MTRPTVGLVAPGEMGAAVAACVSPDVRLLWASAGRSADTERRAAAAGIEDVRTVASLAAASDLVISMCPPHVAVDVAREVVGSGFAGRYLDANAIAPATADRIAALMAETGASYLDGGIIGGPPGAKATGTRLYLAGPGAADVASLFRGSPLTARVLDADPPAASALKLAYAAWTKGSAALLLTARAFAAHAHVEADLLGVWEEALPGLSDRSEGAASNGVRKGWRWVGEMEEIAMALREADLPAGFFDAAAEVYHRLAPLKGRESSDVHAALAALTGARETDEEQVTR